MGQRLDVSPAGRVAGWTPRPLRSNPPPASSRRGPALPPPASEHRQRHGGPTLACTRVPLAQLMEQSPKVNMLPVVDDGRLTGLVTLHALVSAGL